MRRRSVLVGAVAAAGGALVGAVTAGAASLLRTRTAATVTTRSRVVYNLNPDWRFIQQDVPGRINSHLTDFFG